MKAYANIALWAVLCGLILGGCKKPNPAALHQAARDGDLAKVKALLEQGVDVNLKASDNWPSEEINYPSGAKETRTGEFSGQVTPLQVAVKNRQLAISEFLISKGADVNATDHTGATPLFEASDSKLAKLLLDHGARVDIRDCWEYTALHRVARATRDPEAIRAIVKAGADISAVAEVQNTPLHEAVAGDKAEAVQALLELGANPNAKSQSGLTPLHWATLLPIPRRPKGSSVIEILVQRGADVNAGAEDGATPLDLAVAKNNPCAVELLRSLNAKQPTEKQTSRPASGPE